MAHPNIRRTPNDQPETEFRDKVRDALDMDMFTRDFQIIDEIRKLKAKAASFDDLVKNDVVVEIDPEKVAEIIVPQLRSVVRPVNDPQH